MALSYLLALVLIALALAALLALAWIVQQRTGNSGWVDTIWTFAVGGVGAAAALSPSASDALPARQWLIAVLALLWALRLGIHIAIRTAGISDDPRYAAFAQEWGRNAPRRMFIFLQNQALGSVPLVFSIFVAAHTPVASLRGQDFIGAAILAIAIIGEALADAQLKRFRTNPGQQGLCLRRRACGAGRATPTISSSGLAGWLIPVIAIDAGYPWGFAALLAPIFMFWILNYVTGIPPLEAEMLRSRGDAYRLYQAHTSKFFPLPPTA